MHKIEMKTLSQKMFGLLCLGLFAAVVIFLILHFTSQFLLDYYFDNSNYLKQVERERIADLQQYVTKNHVSAMDADKLAEWSGNRDVDYFIISRRRELLFDSSYMARVPIGKTDGDYLHYTWQYMYTVTFEDGDADVLIYEGFESKYYVIVLIGCILAGVLVLLFILIRGVQKEVRYIQELREEVDLIKGGYLEHSIDVKGQDELAQLAYGLNQMRLSLKETNEREEDMKVAEDELITGMSHDLRTPLTGLMTYLEILRQEESKQGKVSREYIDKAYDKSLQIRNLANQLFDFFLARKEGRLELEPPENIESIFSDYLSEMTGLLESSGFQVNMDALEWKSFQVRVNLDYISRIMNNILSNIQKYAEPNTEICLETSYETNRVGIAIKNEIKSQESNIEGNGIGIKNVEFMMQKMNGECMTEIKEKDYRIILWFKIYKS